MSSNSLGEFVKARRIENGISTLVLAEKVRCTPSFIRGIERGAQYPSTDMGERILSALDVDFIVVDSLTLQTQDGHILKFTSTKRGHNGQPIRGSYEKSYRISALEERVAAIEARLNI